MHDLQLHLCPRVHLCPQAEFHLAPLGSQESGETAGALDLLAHASIDVSHDSAVAAALDAPNERRGPQRPSTLERLRELAHLLVGAPRACIRPATALQLPARPVLPK